jgi:L-threonylcarbamoyladenylate synthase
MMGTTLDKTLIARAAELLRAGELVSFPTETVYGLGADASNPEALRRLYQAKGRPKDHPVIVHLSGADEVKQWAASVPASLDALARRFWPGPLTVVLPRAAHVLDQVTGGQATVAVRVPAHALALALLREFKGGLAAPSANRFGRLSPTCALDVEREFGDTVAMVLDGGACEVGIESTILDLSGQSPRILRPGMILIEQIEQVLGVSVEEPGMAEAPSARAPGTLPAHYAPTTPLLLLPSSSLMQKVDALVAKDKSIAVLSFRSPAPAVPPQNWHQARPDAGDYAHELYAALRKLDVAGADFILVEEPPEEAPWTAILDRLRRAAHDTVQGGASSSG